MAPGREPIRVVLFRDASSQWRFRIVAANGEPLAQSEGYWRRVDAVDTARLIVGPDVEITEEA